MVQTNTSNNKQEDSAVVIGGSLSGLMAAIALSDQGLKVKVLEKSNEGTGSGAALQIYGFSSNQTSLEEKLKRLASNGKDSVELWAAIESRLRKEAHSHPNISLSYNKRVISIGEDEKAAWAKTEDGQIFKADILIGADGHRSMVREKINPQHPHAEFAGYLAWMATFLEKELPKDSRPGFNEKSVKIANELGGFLFASVIEEDGEPNRIACTWYDNSQTQLLYRLGAVQDKFVHHSLQGSQLSENDLNILAQEANKHWPQPWLGAVLHAIDSQDFIGVPVKEYVPEKLVLGRFAIVGDAAHVPSPITTGGFNESLIDAVVLAQCVCQGLEGSKAINALDNYQSLRLKKVQEMVKSGRLYSKEFGRY